MQLRRYSLETDTRGRWNNNARIDENHREIDRKLKIEMELRGYLSMPWFMCP